MAVIPRKRASGTVYGDELKALVREAVREELGPRLPVFRAEVAAFSEDEMTVACRWSRHAIPEERCRAFVAALALDGMADLVAANRHRDGWRVYFVQCGPHGPVKIGLTQWFSDRLSDLQIANPETLIVRGLVPGDRTVEMFYHRLFADYRVRGEWFRPSERMELIMRAAEELMGGRDG